jgi:hypothetical protein
MVIALTMRGPQDIGYTWTLADVLGLDIADAEWYAERREEANRDLRRAHER